MRVKSKQPRKQRKYRAKAPLHLRRKMLASNLSKTLREKYKKRNISLRKGDNVKITKGEFKGKIGKINLINLKKIKVAIDGIQKTKKDGTKVNVIFDPSNLQIQELNLDDKMRIKRLKGKEVAGKSESKTEAQSKDDKGNKELPTKKEK